MGIRRMHITPETQLFNIGCPGIFKVKILGAVYGINHCQLDVTDLMQTSLCGGIGCHFTVSNMAFNSDPCLGFVKYLIVFYDCV